MANDVYRAVDASLVVSVGDSAAPEGAAAAGIVEKYDLSNVVGSLRNVVVNATSDVRPFYEIGSRYPTHLRPGVISVTGSAERAHVNGALLRLLLGDGAVSPPAAANFAQPAFNIVTTLASSAIPGGFTKVTLFGVRFDSWGYQVPLDDFVMERVTFQALRIAFEEA
ncbi:hypothetical protein [Kutzneria sp. NPDC052558]|uniref:hypothetical protein n=1 Tax=Kutzneria sp. NPDC052558 TaxID=3364121 RepID=UPI0037CAB5C2